MKLRNFLVPCSLFVVIATIVGGVHSRSEAKATMKPFLVRGGRATPAGVAGPAYGLFTCQVGLSTRTCYDPYQMRTAYKTDTLIAAGFDGRDKTIVIVDAFQSPHIVNELNFYDGF